MNKMIRLIVGDFNNYNETKKSIQRLHASLHFFLKNYFTSFITFDFVLLEGR